MSALTILWATSEASLSGTPSRLNTPTDECFELFSLDGFSHQSALAADQAILVPEDEAALHPDHEGEECQADEAEIKDQ